MTRQRWWDPRKLARVRLGVLMGRYHARCGYPQRHDALVLVRDLQLRELTLYERGLVAGYESAGR